MTLMTVARSITFLGSTSVNNFDRLFSSIMTSSPLRLVINTNSAVEALVTFSPKLLPEELMKQIQLQIVYQ